MKIACVTDDGLTISQHFGRAAYYEVLTVEDGEVTGRERRAKPAHGAHHHQQEGTIQLQVEPGAAEEAATTHSAMAAPIQDCAVVITRGMGRGAYESLRAAGIEPLITDVRDIDEAVRRRLRGDLPNHLERLH